MKTNDFHWFLLILATQGGGSVARCEAREIRKFDAEMDHRHHRVQIHVRHAGSDVPTTFYGHWGSLNGFFGNQPKRTIF